VILQADETEEAIHVKIAIMFSGIVAGSCCADDPTPLCEQPEACELQLEIDKRTALTRITLL
jgi:hypothetical protein